MSPDLALLELAHAFLQCPYKSFLLSTGQAAEADALEFSAQRRADAYRDIAQAHFQMQAQPRRGNDQWIRIPGDTHPGTPQSTPPSVNCVLATRRRSQKGGTAPVHSPLLLVPSERLTKEHKLALALVGRVLSKCGYAVATRGRIIYGASFKTLAVSLDALRVKADKSLEQVEGIQQGTHTPTLRLNPHCKVCRFAQHCRGVASEKDDLSLIPSLSGKEIAKLNRKGIFTVTQLSHTFRPRRKRRHKTPDKYHPALKALAIRERTIYVNRSPEMFRSSVQMFLDVEGLPDQDFYYLIGLRVVGNGKDESYSLWADDHKDEKRIWNEFLKVIEPLEQYSTFHFGRYESQFIDKMLKRYGCTPKPTEKKLRASLVNVLSFCRTDVYFPVYSNSLKEIAVCLGFRRRSPVASGLHSIEWRHRWEIERQSPIQEVLVAYNLEDCRALELVTTSLTQLADNGGTEGLPVKSVDQMKVEKPFRIGTNVFEIPEFEYINKCAYFDYQRAKVYWRTDDNTRKSIRRERRAARRRQRINSVQRCRRPRRCPSCKRQELYRHGAMSRVVYDLRFSRAGVKRWVTKYDAWRYMCKWCRKTFNPRGYPSGKGKYGHQLMAWSIYHCIGLRQSQTNVMAGLRDVFGLMVHSSLLARLKARAAEYYGPVYDGIRRSLFSGRLVHIDETRVSIRGAVGYVWVFANMEEVLYVYSDSREGEILSKMLQGFGGVMVTDFYTAYDSVPCVQQRCLIHLIRDMNDDLFKSPFDGEFKTLVTAFGQLLRPIIGTIDAHGLKHRFLGKHKKEVDRFFRTILEREYTSELGRKYQTRFRKNEDRLFTFLDYDGIPWNNNNAENAIKGFATLRSVIGGCSTENGIRDSLKLLSISQTLRNKSMSFLDFLRSGKKRLASYIERPEG